MAPAPFDPAEAENLEDVSRAAIHPHKLRQACDTRKEREHSCDPGVADRRGLLPAPQMEKQFAVKVVQHIETYWKLLEIRRGTELRLTRMDDDILAHLRRAFPDFDPAATVDEDAMKSKDGKARWRAFMMEYEKTVDDFNFGTIMRSSPATEY